MDAWLHAECNLNNKMRAQYTPQELARLQLGYVLREHGGRDRSGNGADRQRREIRRGQRESRGEMLEDLGFQ